MTDRCSGTVYVINTATQMADATIRVTNTYGGALASGITISPNGAVVYVANAVFLSNSIFGEVVLIDTRSNMVTAEVPGAGGPHAVATTPDGALVYVTNRLYPTGGELGAGR